MEIAKENNCYIAYSAMREVPDGSLRNSTQLIDRNGNIAGIYNKNHPTIRDTEINGTLYGKDADLIECDFGTVACAICLILILMNYDLNM